jgi:hypothetical protein
MRGLGPVVCGQPFIDQRQRQQRRFSEFADDLRLRHEFTRHKFRSRGFARPQVIREPNSLPWGTPNRIGAEAFVGVRFGAGR